MTNTKTLRRSLHSLLAAGGFFTSAVEAAAILGTVAIVPVALHLGTSNASPQSAVAQAHAAKLARNADSATERAVAYAAQASANTAG